MELPDSQSVTSETTTLLLGAKVPVLSKSAHIALETATKILPAASQAKYLQVPFSYLWGTRIELPFSSTCFLTDLWMKSLLMLFEDLNSSIDRGLRNSTAIAKRELKENPQRNIPIYIKVSKGLRGYKTHYSKGGGGWGCLSHTLVNLEKNKFL